LADFNTGVLIGAIAILTVFTVAGWTLWYRKRELAYTKTELEEIVDDRIDRSRIKIKGDIGEQVAPLMKEFIEKYDPADARFLGGKPVDYIVYKNYIRASEEKDSIIEEIVFVEVKTGQNAGLSPIERKIRDAIDSHRVRYDVIVLKSLDNSRIGP